MNILIKVRKIGELKTSKQSSRYNLIRSRLLKVIFLQNFAKEVTECLEFKKSCRHYTPNFVHFECFPNRTAAYPSLALKLDKLNSAFIRCLVLWTVFQKAWFSCFTRLNLLVGGSDVTRGISCGITL